MTFRTLYALLFAMLAASTAQGQMNDNLVPVPDVSAQFDQASLLAAFDGFEMVTASAPAISVHYEQVVSPETFTFNESVAWAVQSFRRPKETLGRAVVLYGYDFNSACDVSTARNLAIPAVLAIQPHVDTAGPTLPYSVTLYETVDEACDAREVVQELANTFTRWILSNDTGLENADTDLANYLSMYVTPFSWSAASASDTAQFNAYSQRSPEGERPITIPGYLPVDTSTAASFAREISEIVVANDDSLIFSVGRLPGAGRGLEMWAFCADVDQCFGHQADGSFTSSHFAGFIDSNFENVVSQDPQSMQPVEGADG